MTRFDFKKIEEDVLSFWKNKDIYNEVKKLGKGKKKFYFLDGPPYTSGKVHLGQAWNKSLKDSIMRYKRKQGFNVVDRAGYDMHGIPTEKKVEMKLGLKTKDDIPKYGVQKFIEECRQFSIDCMKDMNETFHKLGIWQDFENAYQPIDEKFIEGEWWLIKKAHENKRLYEGKRTMTWCSTCATALAKHECEYENVVDQSIFVKFPVQGEEKTYFIIWTTTPWTIPFNLAIMVNPNLDYVKAKVGDEYWYVAKALAASFISAVAEKEYAIESEFKGEKLKGIKYLHPFAEYIPHYKDIEVESPNVHTVLLSEEYVDTSAGTGLVHCAPGCGPEDYEVGVRNNIPPLNTLNENGTFNDEIPKFAGKVAKTDDKYFIELLKEENALIAVTQVEHDYAHCWRCHNPVVFRTTWQWFFKVEDLKQKMIEENNKILWVPQSAYSAFNSWLENLRDNSITRQRFWGTPFPVWKCESCEHYIVISSRKELEELSGASPKDLHIPYIDEVKIPCQCGKEKKRVPDVLDVWVDAGTTSWNSLNYPHSKEDFEKYFPADFILEGKDQIRGWFNLLMVASMISMNKPSFKAVYMHGFVQDSEGRKMSKSLGNNIHPHEVTEKYGVDTFRFYMQGGAVPGVDINYNPDDIVTKFRNLQVVWNTMSYILDISNTYDISYTNKFENLTLEDKYILSLLNSTILDVTTAFDEYRLNEIPLKLENLFLELSRTYIQLVRDLISDGTDEDRQRILNISIKVYMDGLSMFSTICPFVTEYIYQEMNKKFKLGSDSIQLEKFPKADETLVNTELENSFGIFKKLLSSILACRDKSNIGVRWPVSEVIVDTKSEDVVKALDTFSEMLKNSSNVRNITIGAVECKTEIKPNYRSLGKEFGQETTKVAEVITKNSDEIASKLEKDSMKVEGFTIKKDHLDIKFICPSEYVMSEFPSGRVFFNTTVDPELESDGFKREAIRRIQQLRKEAGLSKKDKVKLGIVTNYDKLEQHKDAIASKVGADLLEFVKDKEYFSDYPSSSKTKIKNYEFEFYLMKL